MLELIHDYVRKDKTLHLKTTLSGRGYARLIPQWQEQGYWIKLFFLRLPTPEMAIARVRQRVFGGWTRCARTGYSPPLSYRTA